MDHCYLLPPEVMTVFSFLEVEVAATVLAPAVMSLVRCSLRSEFFLCLLFWL